MSGVLRGIGKVAKGVSRVASPFASLLPGGGLINAGLGALGGILARGKEDPRIGPQQQFLDQVTSAGPPRTAGVNPMSAEAARQYQAMLGQSAADLAPQYFNPFEEKVVGATQADFDRQRTQAMMAADDVATRSRAFGGSRHAILAAEGLTGVNRNEAETLAKLRYGGYSDAVRAAQAGQQFGLQTAGALHGAGDYARGVEQAGYDAPWNRTLQGSQIINQAPYFEPRPTALQAGLGGALAGIGALKGTDWGSLFRKKKKAIGSVPSYDPHSYGRG
jgi:hypothetical protein